MYKFTNLRKLLCFGIEVTQKFLGACFAFHYYQ